MFLCKRVKAIDGVSEGARIADMFPGEGGNACWRLWSANEGLLEEVQSTAERSDWGIDGLDEDAFSVQLQLVRSLI